MDRISVNLNSFSTTAWFRYGVLSLLLLSGSFVVEQAIQERRDAFLYQQNEHVVIQAAEMRGSLENELNSAVFIARGLEALILGFEHPTDAELQATLQRLYSFNPSIRNIGLAPGNVITHIYPLRGNEAALGLDYAKVPVQWNGVKRAMDTRQSVLVGPIHLVQGGRAIINRTPVFLEDAEYWGIVTIVIDLKSLMEQAGVGERYRDIRLQIAGDQSSGNNSSKSNWVLGDGSIDQSTAVRMSIRVPSGEWAIYAEPLGGWQKELPHILALRLGGYGVAILLAAFVLIMLASRAQARSMAADLLTLNDEISATNDVLEYMSRYDPLTNVANRRYFDEALERSWATCVRGGLPLSVLMVDADHFKRINDEYGHSVGDECLVRIATLITGALRRPDDMVARYGGEEFIVMAAGADQYQAMASAERIRAIIAGTLVEHGLSEKPPLRMTVSVGVATHLPNGTGNLHALCKEADDALYRAKETGRNRVCHFKEIETSA